MAGIAPRQFGQMENSKQGRKQRQAAARMLCVHCEAACENNNALNHDRPHLQTALACELSPTKARLVVCGEKMRL
jgi:hypothetical protein